MIEPARIISKVQHIRHPVGTDGGLAKQLLNQQVHLVVHTGTGLELTELPVARELMAERLLTALEDKVAEVDHLIVQRFPYDITDAGREGVTVLEARGPVRQSSVIRCSGDTARPVINPDGAVGGMAGRENGRITVGRNGQHHALTLAGNLQFITYSGDGQVLRRGFIQCIESVILIVIHAEDGLKGLTVQPALTNDTVLIRAGSRNETSHGRGCIGSVKGILGLRVHTALIHQTDKAALSVQRRESLQIIRAKLVDHDIHHQAGHLGRGLRLGSHDGEQSHE